MNRKLTDNSTARIQYGNNCMVAFEIYTKLRYILEFRMFKGFFFGIVCAKMAKLKKVCAFGDLKLRFSGHFLFLLSVHCYPPVAR